MCHFTTADIAAEIGRSRQQVNTVCRELFGPARCRSRRWLDAEQRERVLRAFEQPGRWQKSSFQFVSQVQSNG
jgi:AraC-like DNA-binding protein